MTAMNFLLIIDINGWWIALIILIIAYLILATLSKFSELKEQQNRRDIKEAQQEGLLREKDLIIQKVESDMKGLAQEEAQKWFEKWKADELGAYRKVIETAGAESVIAQVEQWKMQFTTSIRKDAANRSTSVLLGKVSEHLIPYSEYFGGLNPRDARFIGSPIDLIVFDGASDKDKRDITIHFVEIKTGTSALTPLQKKIKEAVDEHRIEWKLISLKDFGDEVKDEISSNPI